MLRNGNRKLVTHGCGQCEYCLKKRQRDWVMRCSWEARKHPYNWIVTLTYADEWLTFTEKGNATLNKRDFQLFMKRLRKRYPDDKIRYLVRGEYGGMFGRPHMHLILFGFKACSVEEVGFRLSDEWHYGGVYVDTYSDRAVQYVTSYILKADDLSVYNDPDLVLPFINVSQRPMIGENFLDSQTADRAMQLNDYVFQGENDINVSIPRRFAQKLDERATDNPFHQQFRKHDRAVCVSSNNVTHYDAGYNLHRQVLRAEAIAEARHREYIRNKAKD